MPVVGAHNTDTSVGGSHEPCVNLVFETSFEPCLNISTLVPTICVVGWGGWVWMWCSCVFYVFVPSTHIIWQPTLWVVHVVSHTECVQFSDWSCWLLPSFSLHFSLWHTVSIRLSMPRTNSMTRFCLREQITYNCITAPAYQTNWKWHYSWSVRLTCVAIYLSSYLCV